MRLDFTVLWIDNLPNSVVSYQERLDLEVRKEGFRLVTVSALSFEEAQVHLRGEVILDDIDLVLVDYDLGANVTKGDIAVREIRNLVPYKDIILYSSNATINLKQMVLAEGIEGVFCAYRESLVDTMIGAFDSLVKKVLDLDHCRGIVMGVTSDIDQIVHDCLLELAPKLDETQIQQAASYALEKVDGRLDRFQRARDQFAENNSIEALLAVHEAFTALDKLGLLKKIMGLQYVNEHVGIRKSIGKYANDVPPLRNKLGHVRLVVEGGRRTLRGREAASVTVDELKDLRRLLLDYRDTFESLASILGVDIDEAVEVVQEAASDAAGTA